MYYRCTTDEESRSSCEENVSNPTGEAENGVLRLDFDRGIMVQFRGSAVTPDAGLLAYRELDDALGLTSEAGDLLADARTSKNGRHALVGMLRQSIFGRRARRPAAALRATFL
ncbi:MAG TPA: transposase [Candidatus Baltobacteraceae bacterium]|jgi:hypothetical protein|nr:transposase [Candidatus Baltobacteraceae bacterium]